MDTDVLVQESRSMLNRASEIQVACDEDYAEAGEFIMGCKQLVAKITAAHALAIQAAYDSHKAALALRDGQLLPIKEAMASVSAVALKYKQEQDRLAREEAQAAERERLRKEEEARLLEAQRLEAEGKTDEAEAVLDKPIEKERPSKMPSVLPKVAGLSTRKSWKHRIVNPDLVKREYCSPNPIRINGVIEHFVLYVKHPTAEQIKELEAKVGGVEFYEEEVFSGRLK